MHGLWNGPPSSDIWCEILEILLLHVLYNDACKFTINLFPISWEPSQNVNLFYICYCKCRFEMAIMMLYYCRKPHKRYQCKTYISDFSIKCCGMDPPSNGLWGIHIRPQHHFSATLHRGKMCIVCGLWNGPPSSDIWWNSWKFYFCMYSTMMHANLP